MDPGLNSLLKWSIENSEGAQQPNGAPAGDSRPLDREAMDAALNGLFGGPSDADLMKESMTAIQDPSINLENKLVAFDNFEQLVENIDNANNLSSLGLWTPLLDQLKSPESEIRRMAAWCVGTSVQNNEKAQERLLALDGIISLSSLAVKDANSQVRRKAIYALSSSVRNYQPGLNSLLSNLPPEILGDKAGQKIEAGDMDSIDKIMNSLKERSP